MLPEKITVQTERINDDRNLFNLIFTLARPGDNVVTTLNTFGEGYKQSATIFPERCGVNFRFVKNPTDPAAWDEEMNQNTRLVWIETPSNPTLFITNITAIADVAHGSLAHAAIFRNTFPAYGQAQRQCPTGC